jgi:hypothetical protein
MGCPSEVYVGDNFTFSVTTHDPDTGVLTDADAVPTYRIYEDDTGTAILNGNMAKLDDANTTGFYVKKVAGSTANGFEVSKTYTIYIEATVDSDKGGISYSFQTNPLTSAIAAKLSASADTIVLGTVSHDNTEATTTVFYSDDITEATTNHYKDRVVIFRSGDVARQAKIISGYELSAGEGKFTVPALTEAPADNVTFIIV